MSRAFFVAAAVVAAGWAPSVSAVPKITATTDDGTAVGMRKLAGDLINYTIAITNAGDATDATGVVLTDPTPTYTTLIPTSVNVSPLAFDDSYVAVGNTTLRVGNPVPATGPFSTSAIKVTANDKEFLGDSFVISAADGASAHGGVVAMVTTGADAGSFSYLPPPGYRGMDTFGYTIRDDGTDGIVGNNDDLTSEATVTITVTDMVWYVDTKAAGGGTGRSTAPLRVLAALDTGGALDSVDGPDDFIFIYSGGYSGGFALEPGQRLIGEPAGLTVGDLTITAGGTRPVLSHNSGSTLSLSMNNTVSGIDFSNSAGNGIDGSAVGTLTLSDVDVTVTGGTALGLTTSGTVSATGSDNDLTSTDGAALIVTNVNIGAADLTFKSISAGNGNDSAGNGISLDTTGSAGGLHVTGKGPNIGATGGGVIQHKRGADGSTTAGNGIYLNSTSEVSLNGMELNNFENHGILGLSVSGLRLTRSNIGGTIGTSSGSNDLTSEVPIQLGRNSPIPVNGLSGSSLIDSVQVSGGIQHNVEVYQDSGTFSLTISNCHVHDNDALLGSDGIHLETAGSAAAIVKINNSVLANNKLRALDVRALGSSTLHLTLQANNVSRTTQGIEGFVLRNASSAHCFVAVMDNTFTGITGTNVLVGNTAANTGSASSLDATVRGNTMTMGTPLDHALVAALSSMAGQSATSRIYFDNNVINAVSDPVTGLPEPVFVGPTDAGSSPVYYGTVTRNKIVIADPTGTALRGLIVESSQNGGASHVDVRANVVTYSGEPGGALSPPAVQGIRVRQVGTGMMELEPGTASGEVGAVLAVNNPPPHASGTEVLGNVTVSANNSTAVLPFSPATPSLPAFLILEATAHFVDPVSSDVPSADHHGIGNDGVLPPSDLPLLFQAAVARWHATGLTASQAARLEHVTVGLEEIPGPYLGKTLGDRVILDVDAAGSGWFIDRTPDDDIEFAGDGPRLLARLNAEASGRVDVLTAIIHELGHTLGLDDSYARVDGERVMFGWLHLSERRLPVRGEAQVGAPCDDPEDRHEHHLTAPINIGILPPNRIVTVTYRVRIDIGITSPSVSNQGTVTGSNFASVFTDDLPQPGGLKNPTLTEVEVPPTIKFTIADAVEDTVYSFAASDFAGVFTDANNDPLHSIRVLSLPKAGILLLGPTPVALNQEILAADLNFLTYTPNPDVAAGDNFLWKASDGTLISASDDAVFISIRQVNDPPRPAPDLLVPVPEDAAPISIFASGLAANDAKGPADENGQTLTVTEVSSAVGGTVTLNANEIIFTPDPDFNGEAAFTYTVFDDGTTLNIPDPKSSTGVAKLPIFEVNDPPIAIDDTQPDVFEDSGPVVFSGLILTSNDKSGAANESNQNLSVTSVGNAVGGTAQVVTGSVVFTPTPNYHGLASFAYTLRDDGTTHGLPDPRTDTAIVRFNVVSVNDGPVAVADFIEREPTQGVTVTVATLLANDSDPDGGSPNFVAAAPNSVHGGVVTVNGGVIAYDPPAGFTGLDSFSYTINDGQGGTGIGIVTVAIKGTSDPSGSVIKVELLGDGSRLVTFSGIPGRTYQVQTSEVLAVGSWTNRAALTADAEGLFQYLDAPPLPGTRFYRSTPP